MNHFNPHPSAWPSAIAIIISLAVLAYGLWIIWPFLSLAWMILWW